MKNMNEIKEMLITVKDGKSGEIKKVGLDEYLMNQSKYEIVEEKVYTYTNNSHCPGNRAKFKVESHKYPNDTTHRGHSVWIDYYFNIEQLKRCFRHNDYMDAEKFYQRVGRSWVEVSLNL